MHTYFMFTFFITLSNSNIFFFLPSRYFEPPSNDVRTLNSSSTFFVSPTSFELPTVDCKCPASPTAPRHGCKPVARVPFTGSARAQNEPQQSSDVVSLLPAIAQFKTRCVFQRAAGSTGRHFTRTSLLELDNVYIYTYIYMYIVRV